MRLLVISTLLMGASAQASDNPAMTTTPKGAFPFSGSLTWGHSLGQGSFVRNYYARDAQYSQSLGLSGSWRLPMKGFSLSASQSWSMELTTGGSMRNHELNYGDIGMSLSTPLGFKAFGFGVGTRFGASIPVSKVSRFMGKVSGVSVAMGGRRKLTSKLSMLLAMSVSRGLYTERIRSVSVSDGRSFVDSNGNTLTPYNQICRTEELINNDAGETLGCRIPGVNGGINLTTAVNFIYNPSKKWSVSLATLLINSFKDYTLPDDQFTSSYASTGIGRSDRTSGSLGVSYKYSKKVGFSLVSQTSQPALFWSSNDTADANGNVTTAEAGSWYPNFPWWDFRTPGNNYSSVYIDARYSF